MTAIYSTRLIYLTFHGKSNLKAKEFAKVKEAPIVMIVPVLLLSIGAIFSGFFFYHIVKYNTFWNNSLYFKEDVNFVENAHHIPFLFKLFPIITVLLFSFVVLFYFSKLNKFLSFNNKIISKLLIVIKEKWYFDLLYNFIFVKKLFVFSNFLWKKVDQKIIDGLGPLGISQSVYLASRYLKEFQNGKIFSYATYMVLGIVLFFSLIFISF